MYVECKLNNDGVYCNWADDCFYIDFCGIRDDYPNLEDMPPSCDRNETNYINTIGSRKGISKPRGFIQ